MVVKVLFELFDKIWSTVPLQYQPESLLGFDIPGVSIIVACLLLWATGILVTNFIGRHVIQFYEALLKRIPLVRSIYHAVKQALSVVLTSQGESFR